MTDRSFFRIAIAALICVCLTAGWSWAQRPHHGGGQHMPHTPNIPHIPNIPNIPYGPNNHHVPNNHHIPDNHHIPHIPTPDIWDPPVTPSPTPHPQPKPDVEPEPNQVVVSPEDNHPFDHVEMTDVTQEMVDEWKEETTEKNKELTDKLDELTHGELDKEIDGILDEVNEGKLTPEHLAELAKDMAPHLPKLDDQIEATKLIKQLQVNNLLMRAFINININIGWVNININIGGWWGFWNPWIPWNQVFWFGPGVWMRGCPGCYDYLHYCDQCTYADATSVPYSLADPIPESEGRMVTDGVLLMNVGKKPVAYTVEGQSFTMSPGYKQVLPDRSEWTVGFDRGGSAGRARYALESGTYKFTPTEQGWELFQHSFDAVLDNGDNPFEFKFVLNNRRRTVPAKETAPLHAEYPMLVRFDNGRGKIRKKFLQTGQYKLAVGADGTLDLFRPKGVTVPRPSPRDKERPKDDSAPNYFAKPGKITPALFDMAAKKLPKVKEPDQEPAAPGLFGPPKKPEVPKEK